GGHDAAHPAAQARDGRMGPQLPSTKPVLKRSEMAHEFPSMDSRPASLRAGQTHYRRWLRRS
ncbi:MAG: hypothetical protein KGM87_15785, partial [Betaproteobacteria bacterium]|nr:hypothetical protein [Betaproteobacteria bacterium]